MISFLLQVFRGGGQSTPKLHPGVNLPVQSLLTFINEYILALGKKELSADGFERLWGSFFRLQCPTKSRRQSRAPKISLLGWAQERLSPGGLDAWREEPPRSRLHRACWHGEVGREKEVNSGPSSVTANLADREARRSAGGVRRAAGEKRRVAPQ